jgi:hypothetical protein
MPRAIYVGSLPVIASIRLGSLFRTLPTRGAYRPGRRRTRRRCSSATAPGQFGRVVDRHGARVSQSQYLRAVTA